MMLYFFIVALITAEFIAVWSMPSRFMSVLTRKCAFGAIDVLWARRQSHREVEIEELVKKFNENVPLSQMGPNKTDDYNPRPGFEPYWEGGDWVYKPAEELSPKLSPKKMMCGVRCSDVYLAYGTICGKNKHKEYRTFDNYCHMRRVDCNDAHGWDIIHRGRCLKLPLAELRNDVDVLVANKDNNLKYFSEQKKLLEILKIKDKEGYAITHYIYS